MDNYKFWMVWCKSGSIPKHRHPTKAEAVAEAGRLAGENAGQSFFVLEATELFRSRADVDCTPLTRPAPQLAPAPNDF